MADVYVVIHIATTFDDAAVYVPRDACELIALSWCTVDAASLEISPPQSILVKPSHTPITPECSLKHKLSWDTVKTGSSFKDAIAEFDHVLSAQIADKSFSFVTGDTHDLRVSLPREARDKGVVLPVYLQHPRIFDLCNEYSKWQSTHPEAMSYPSSSLANIITALAVDVPEKWSEEASNDDRSTVDVYASILVQLAKKSVPVDSHSSVLTKPFDSALDAKVFLSERSKILYLSNLPSDTTNAELESWFGQLGGHPVAFWALKNADSDTKNITAPKTKGISGFAVFSSHEEAAESLYMNGRALMDRVVEVQASSTRVLDRASGILAPFPSSKNRPRPGDWTCPSCGFSNFQRRIACFRCSFPATSAVAINEQIYTGSGNNSHDGLLPVTSMRRHKTDDKQNISHNGVKTGNTYGLYGHGFNHNHNHNHSGNGQRSNYGNSVPFRAGDWKCINESCQYHNFAKNICCLKCGASKPESAGSQGHAQPNGPVSHNSSAGNASANGSIHSVSNTAAAIATATASGQPLNLSNNFFNLQQPQPNHSRHSPGSQSSSSSSPIHQNGLYSNISQLQQLQFQQSKAHGNSHVLQQYPMSHGQRSNHTQNSSPGPGNSTRQNAAHSANNSPGLYLPNQGYSYRGARESSEGGYTNSSTLNSLTTQISSINLNTGS